MADITLSVEELLPVESRFHRFTLINWWNQERLINAKVVVIGAGALGNEIIKNICLLGFGNLFIADMDRIENSNLSRSVLFRASDNGKFKAEIAAKAARDIYPEIYTHSFTGNIVHDLGMGVYRWADVVVGGLDNRLARISINKSCYRVGRPWIDGGIEQIQGTASVFKPDGPCYECTMSKTDWKLVNKLRNPCNGLTKAEMEKGKTPTTPTISSIIAGVQCQEAVKLIHGMEVISGRRFIFQGLTTDSYLVDLQRKEECEIHDPFEYVVELNEKASTITAKELLELAQSKLGAKAWLEPSREILEKMVCKSCGVEEAFHCSLGKIKTDRLTCPSCGEAQREVCRISSIRGDESFIDDPLSDIGVPPFDIVTARSKERLIGFELSGDAADVLGPLWEPIEMVQLE
jgi:molybdopterin/thiamine biosynthesis adenylyltransferase